MKRILSDLYTFTGLKVGRVYLIKDPDGLSLVDCSLSSAPARITEQLARAGHRPTDVKRILVTHAHPDHVGGLPRMQAFSGAEVIASAIERPYVEGKLAPRIPLADRLSWLSGPLGLRKPLPGTHVDREVRDGDLIPEVMGGLVALHTPGHSPGHLAFWQPERRILFCGDTMLRVVGLRLPIPLFTTNMDEDRRSIARLAALNPTVILSGHGQPLIADAAILLRAFSRRVSAG